MSISAMKQALEALVEYEQYIQPLTDYFGGPKVPKEGSTSAKVNAAITALRAAIEQAELAQPVARSLMCVCGAVWDIKADGSEEMVHTPDAAPPRKPLTDEEIKPFVQKAMKYYGYDPDKYGKTTSAGFYVLARAIEAAHGIKQKNT